MITGIGVDIVEVARVEALIKKFDDRFARRILRAEEMIEFERRKYASSFLATRFAVKEAVAKALGTGIGKKVSFQGIQVVHDERGKPGLKFFDTTAEFVSSEQISNALVSLSDEKHYVVAMVVLER
jgi:holo-[acyl-carrier protein] synthase